MARMPSQHKHRPVAFRPPEGDRARLLAYAERTGRPVGAVVSEAVRLYLDDAERPERQHLDNSTADGAG